MLEEQHRTRWNQIKIREGVAVLDGALTLVSPGPYQMQASISALRAEAATAADLQKRLDEMGKFTS